MREILITRVLLSEAINYPATVICKQQCDAMFSLIIWSIIIIIIIIIIPLFYFGCTSS